MQQVWRSAGPEAANALSRREQLALEHAVEHALRQGGRVVMVELSRPPRVHLTRASGAEISGAGSTGSAPAMPPSQPLPRWAGRGALTDRRSEAGRHVAWSARAQASSGGGGSGSAASVPPVGYPPHRHPMGAGHAGVGLPPTSVMGPPPSALHPFPFGHPPAVAYGQHGMFASTGMAQGPAPDALGSIPAPSSGGFAPTGSAMPSRAASWPSVAPDVPLTMYKPVAQPPVHGASQGQATARYNAGKAASEGAARASDLMMRMARERSGNIARGGSTGAGTGAGTGASTGGSTGGAGGSEAKAASAGSRGRVIGDSPTVQHQGWAARKVAVEAAAERASALFFASSLRQSPRSQSSAVTAAATATAASSPAATTTAVANTAGEATTRGERAAESVPTTQAGTTTDQDRATRARAMVAPTHSAAAAEKRPLT